ncbi:AsmA family protein [Halopseudomonas pelagia]|uniref:AsmA family protein n=1 Tax=Halopseudomonas pelagia TaxID=553151 RepID=UPI0030DAD6F4|tara:strand:+ start:59593 stop:61770 length:2178 start_codon:yes stop_codon:yes gene_type:complete
MKSFAKVLGLVIFGVVLLAAGVLFFLTRMFDPNDYKDDIQQAARDKANIELTLGGDIGWSLFPWLGIELKDVGIATLDAPEDALAQVGSMGLGVKVLPLLRRQLRMSDVILDSVSLNLAKDAQGRGNWESVGPDSDAAATPEPGASEIPDRSSEQAGRDFDVAVESVRITNARVRYEDESSGQVLQLEDVNLTTGALVEGQPFDLAFLGLLTTEQPATRVRIDLKTVAQFDFGLERYQLEAVDLKVDVSGQPLSGRALSLQLRGDGLLDQGAQIAEFNQMRLSVADLRATGQVRASQLDSDVRLDGRVDVADFDARALLAALGQEVPETAKSGALQSVALSAVLSGSATSLMLEELKLLVDGTQLTGSLGIADFERQAVRFDLSGGSLNLDDYLPPAEETAGEAPAQAPSGGSRSDSAPEDWSDEQVLPLQRLASLDIDGKLTLDELRITGQTVAPFTAAVVARDGKVEIKQADGGVFGGRFSVTAEIDTTSTPVSLKVAKQLTGMDSLAVQRAYDMGEQMRGKLDFNLNVTASGNSVKRWMDTLNGSARFNVLEGALIGVNLEQQMCQAIALVNRKTLAEPRGSQDTPFSSLGGSFRITNGTVSGEDLVMAIPGIGVKGRGKIELPQQRMDYRLGLLIKGDQSAMPDPACVVNERYIAVEWPVRCQGFLHNAASSCAVDTDGVKSIAGQLLGSEAQRKVEEKLEEKLGDQAPAVRDAIRGLFNR